MLDRRSEPRVLAADRVDIRWTDQAQRTHRVLGSLDDVSRSGARLLLNRPIRVGTVIEIVHPDGRLGGKVRNCALQETGYSVGVELSPASPTARLKVHRRTPSKRTRLA